MVCDEKKLQEKDSRQLLQPPHLQSPLQSRRKHVMYHRKIRLSQKKKNRKRVAERLAAEEAAKKQQNDDAE